MTKPTFMVQHQRYSQFFESLVKAQEENAACQILGIQTWIYELLPCPMEFKGIWERDGAQSFAHLLFRMAWVLCRSSPELAMNDFELTEDELILIEQWLEKELEIEFMEEDRT